MVVDVQGVGFGLVVRASEGEGTAELNLDDEDIAVASGRCYLRLYHGSISSDVVKATLTLTAEKPPSEDKCELSQSMLATQK